MKIYIVCGTSGEYSDRSEWEVVAYRDEGLAKKHVERVTAEAKRVIAKRLGDWTHREPDDQAKFWDPHMCILDDEISYYISEVELRDELPDASVV